MFGRLWKAIGTLIANAEALASTFGEANTVVRARLGLDVTDQPEQPAQLEDNTAEATTGKRTRKAS